MFVRNKKYPETPRSKTEYTSPEGETSFLQKCFGAYDRVYRHAVSAGTAKWRTSGKPKEQGPPSYSIYLYSERTLGRSTQHLSKDFSGHFLRFSPILRDV